jgi:hypothetical protein
MAEVAGDLKGIFAVHRKESTDAVGNFVSAALASAFVEHGKRFVHYGHRLRRK